MESLEYTKMFQLEDRHWWFVAKRRFTAAILSTLSLKQAKILDVGCGTGRNMLMLQEFGTVSGVDLSPLAIKYCRQRGLTQLQQGSADSLPFPASSFDLVTLFDVLYHQGIKSDIKVLQEVFRVLQPKGYILITDCAHPWLFGPHDQVMQARQRYTKKELTQKLTSAGFTVIRASYLFMFTFPVFVVNRLLKKYFNVS
ncbi:MAG: class I SAM-dependent methyltransferase, partial [Candidatus Beckwithbacteria bacterium]|nr:class I SAM-dependent methyltransferase [Candidatus Beckwithbacteria bacterium]